MIKRINPHHFAILFVSIYLMVFDTIQGHFAYGFGVFLIGVLDIMQNEQ